MDKLPFLSRLPFLERRKEPLEGIGARLSLIAFSVLLALIVGSVFFLPFKVDPWRGYLSLVTTAFTNRNGLAYTMIKACPLMLVGLGTVLAFRTGFRYLGFEGAVELGGMAAVWFALKVGPGRLFGPLPPLVSIVLCSLCAFACGGVWAAIVGLAKARYGGSEVIVSLMGNYIALLLVNWLISGPMRQPGEVAQTGMIPAEMRLPFVLPGTRAHAGILAAVVLVFAVYVFLRRTPLGYKMIVSGDNPRAARYSGINVVRIVILAAFLAGGLGGLAGGIEVLGFRWRVTEGFSSDLGRLGIIVALLGGLDPLGVLLAAVLYAGMGVGAEAMQRRTAIPTAVVYTIQGLIVMVLLGADILRCYRIVWPKRVAQHEVPS